MNRIGLYTLACMMMTMIACQKDYIEIPEEQEGTPVFSTTFSLDGTTTEFVAGLNDYYMFADQKIDENDVFVYTGNFADEACATETCATSIQFEIRSGSTVPDPQPSNNLMVADYVFKDDSQEELDVYQVKFEGEYEEAELSETYWLLGDDSPSVRNEVNLVHNYTIDSPSDEIVARFFVQSNKGHLASSGRTIYFNGETPCAVDFDVVEDQNGVLEFKANTTSDSDALLFLWTEGFSTDFEISENIVPDLDSLFTVEYNLGVFFDNDCYSEMTRSFSQNTDGSLAYANSSFSYDIIKKYENGSRLGLSTFAIQYVDEKGKVFRSDRQEQSELSYFRILSMEDYDINEKGLPTKKLNVEYRCQVFADDGEMRQIQNGTGVIAVAIEH